MLRICFNFIFWIWAVLYSVVNSSYDATLFMILHKNKCLEILKQNLINFGGMFPLDNVHGDKSLTERWCVTHQERNIICFFQYYQCSWWENYKERYSSPDTTNYINYHIFTSAGIPMWVLHKKHIFKVFWYFLNFSCGCLVHTASNYNNGDKIICSRSTDHLLLHILGKILKILKQDFLGNF